MSSSPIRYQPKVGKIGLVQWIPSGSNVRPNMTRDFQLVLMNHLGQHFTGKVSCELKNIVRGDAQTRICWARLSCNLQEFVARGEDYFSAFAAVRRQLEPLNIRVLCYGACRNVYPSGLLRDMAAGLKAYKLSLGQKPDQSDIVGIFDQGPEMDIASVDDQRRFYDQWLNSFLG